MKTTRHSLMAKGIIVLLSLLVLIFAVSFSWFANNPEADASGISVCADAQGDFEYAIGFYNTATGNNYVHTPFTNDPQALDLKNLSIEGEQDTVDLLADYKPIDVTGDGATLIRPAMTYGNSKIDTTTTNYSYAVPNKQYINFDLIFRSETEDFDIKLASDSFAVAKCEGNTKADVGKTNGLTSTTNKSNVDAFRQSTYSKDTNKTGNNGNYFSKDAVVGAVRIAFTQYNEGTTSETGVINSDNILDNTDDAAYLKTASEFIWVPRPDIRLSPYISNNIEQTTGWTLYTGQTSGASFKHEYYPVFESNATYKDGSGNAVYKTYDTAKTVFPSTLNTESKTFATIGNKIPVTVTEGGITTTYYYTKVNVRIWVEGTDAEARRAISGGEFMVNFNLSTT